MLNDVADIQVACRPGAACCQKASRGATLTELIVVMVVMGLLASAALPAMATWIRDSRVKAVAQGLLATLQRARIEAIRLDQQFVLIRSNADVANASGCLQNVTSSNTGVNWVLQPTSGGGGSGLSCGALADFSKNIFVKGPALVCFNAAGRVVANANPTPFGSCSMPGPDKPLVFDISDIADFNDIPEQGGRLLRVEVGLSGRPRLCNPTSEPGQQDACS